MYIQLFIVISRGYVYSPPEDKMTDPLLSGYCTEIFCYNKVINHSRFTPDLCNSSYCEVETPIPTVPDVDNHHWFFDKVLYIGGAIHLMMSLAMVISYFLINTVNFVLPNFIRAKYGILYSAKY